MELKKGFTLSEVLITLGIVGVVVSMTIPAVIRKYRENTTVAQLQKFYTTMNQALKRSELDNGEYKYWDLPKILGNEVYFNKYWKPYLQVLKICKTYKDCGYSAESPFKRPDGRQIVFSVVYPSARTTFKLTDGTTIINVVNTFDENNTLIDLNYIYVDLNGGKAPNMLGRDVFLFDRDERGIIMQPCPGWSEQTIIKNCKETGACCSAKIIRDGWKIKEDYPVKI